jgi:hypothetical protein
MSLVAGCCVQNYDLSTENSGFSASAERLTASEGRHLSKDKVIEKKQHNKTAAVKVD